MLRPTVRSPRVRTITFLSSICRIYSTILEQHWASSCVVDSPELCEPSIRFVFLRPRVCHRASFRFSAIGRMSFWLTPRGGHPCRRLMVGAVYLHSGLSPPSYCPCRAHNERRRSLCANASVKPVHLTDFRVESLSLDVPQNDQWQPK